MSEAETGELRGFDSYRVRLGDEMRGERASLGKSLLDVQRELRVKAAHIDAIENSDPSGIPHRGFVTGYVRAYARYLGMDEDEVLRRFCEESGFEPNARAAVERRRGPAATPGRRDDLDAVIAGSRLAAASRAASINADLGSTLRGLGSLSVMAALVGGLGYGGWALLQNIQRVEFAPLPEAPEALAALPDMTAITRIAQASVGPAPSIDPGALAAVYAAQEAAPPRVALRDGPISALDPARAGVYAASDPDRPAAADATTIDPPLALAIATLEERSETEASPAPEVVETGVALVVDSEAWVRVRSATGGVLHEALMQAGQRWRAPEGAEGLTLRAGNAGGVFLEVDGARYGPLGRLGAVVSNVLLDAEAVRRVFPSAVTEAAPEADAATELASR